MPWTVADVDKHKKGLTAKQKRQWVNVANSVLTACMGKGGNETTCAGKAIRAANSTVGKTEGFEVTMENVNELIELYAASISGEDEALEAVGSKKQQDKPGGSSAGTYPKSAGPFCGPSGGAPKGTYPVGTSKKAKAALAYARHAPNPAGIKACVYRHWPGFPGAKKAKAKGK